ncbi:sugar phosphate nucleotidyltransferase [Scopulibacillus cellulosilyticus]|uniref:Sugar phosphate nucleotidyltransferase n=1 Tax=Scopulibacillus cellulosilyticus TaxID=2665665 RepID=A0ABW2PUZ9_9BACL
MQLILLSGGSGKRLWPLSNDSRSKQFLRVLDDNYGQLSSMVQRVWGQLSSLNLHNSTVIATSKSQVDMIQSQIGQDVPLVIEPERRDTFPAIALAAVYLYSIKGVSLNEVISVLPVDPYVDKKFFNRVKDLGDALLNTDSDLALLGVKPTFPSSKYGYIVPKTVNNDMIQVCHFKEKPTEERAKQLINQSALWNCGVFSFKLNYIISMLEEKGLPIQFDELVKLYDKLPKNSFDYEVLEKTKSIVALSYDGYWKDLGTWNTLTEEMATCQIGKGKVSKDSQNTHLINELDIPIMVLGVSNVVVAASPDGILVSDKNASPRIKEMLKDTDPRPMYEERRWGWYRVLDYTKYKETGKEVLTKRIKVKKGQNISYQKHELRQEVWTIVNGQGQAVINGEFKSVNPGDVLTIAVGTEHAIKANSNLEFIEVQTGTQLIEEDILRICMDWDEIERYCGVVK